jgi:hypothetical protein
MIAIGHESPAISTLDKLDHPLGLRGPMAGPPTSTR